MQTMVQPVTISPARSASSILLNTVPYAASAS